MAADVPPAAPSDGQNQADQAQVWRPFAALGQLGRQMASAFWPQHQENGGTVDRTLSLWLLGLIPAVFACLRIMIIARGNTETLKSLMENLNVTALVLATTIPIGSTLLTWWLFFSLISKVGPERKQGWWVPVALLLIVVGAIDFYAMPMQIVLANVGCIVVLVVCMFVVVFLRHRRHPAVEKINTRMAQGWGLLIVAVPLLIWLNSGVWLPQENLTVAGARVERAYVLSYNERWVKYMDDARIVHIAPTACVTSRALAGARTSLRYQTAYLLWHDWWAKLK